MEDTREELGNLDTLHSGFRQIDYRSFWDRLCLVTSESFLLVYKGINFGLIHFFDTLDFKRYVHDCDRKLNLLTNLDTMLGCKVDNDNYKGTWLHHLIRDENNITNTNLVYAVAVVIACGGDFYGVKDSNGITGYALLARTRYPGIGCLSLDIYSYINNAVIRCQREIKD